MPVGSLNSSILKWPDAQAVSSAVRQWARQAAALHKGVAIGYYGSYARGDWGVGSDLDLVVILDDSKEMFERRAVHWDTAELPVPCNMVVYTQNEWTALRGSRFHETVMKEAVWVEGGRALLSTTVGFKAAKPSNTLVRSSSSYVRRLNSVRRSARRESARRGS